MPLADEELVERLRQSDQSAYATIFQKYNTLLFAHAYKKLQDKNEAQDLVQEIFLSLWKNREHAQIDNLMAYLFTAVRYKFFNIISHKQVEAKHLESLRNFVGSETPIADYLVRERIFMELIEHEISLLPPRMRLVFQMSRKQHLSHKEIALELGISEQTVTDQIKKALKILRPRLSMLCYVALTIELCHN